MGYLEHLHVECPFDNHLERCLEGSMHSKTCLVVVIMIPRHHPHLLIHASIQSSRKHWPKVNDAPHCRRYTDEQDEKE
jgi:hypothetical protein